MSETYSAQAIAKALVPKIPGLLSAIASSCVIYDILGRKRRFGTRNRLLIGLSISDIVGSISFGFVSSWAIPRGTPGVFLAAGNDATCKAQGFLLQLCNTTSPLYSGSLAFYYLLTITRGWSEDDLKKYHILLHGIPIFFGFATAVVGLALDLYHPVGLWCWYGPPGIYYDAFRWGMAHSFIWSSIFFGAFVMVKLYREVRRLEKATEQYLFTKQLKERQPRSSSLSRGAMGPQQLAALRKEPSIKVFINGESEEHRERSSTISWAMNDSNGSLSSSGEEKKRRHSREVAIQGILFTGAYFLAFIGGFLTRLVQCITGKVYFGLIIIMAALLPAQGIFNFIVYMRPRWRKKKLANSKRRSDAASSVRLSFPRGSFIRMQLLLSSLRTENKGDFPGDTGDFNDKTDEENVFDLEADTGNEGGEEKDFGLDISEDGRDLDDDEVDYNIDALEEPFNDDDSEVHDQQIGHCAHPNQSVSSSTQGRTVTVSLPGNADGVSQNVEIVEEPIDDNDNEVHGQPIDDAVCSNQTSSSTSGVRKVRFSLWGNAAA